MISISTKSGFKAEINEDKLQDFRFLTYMVKVVKGADDFEKLDAYMSMMDMIFSKNQKNDFMDHIAALNDGIANTEKVIAEFNDIIEKCKESSNKVKN